MFLLRDKWAILFRIASVLFILYVALLGYGEVKDGLALREQERIAEQERQDKIRIAAADLAIDPVEAIELDLRECFQGEFLVSGFLSKTRYPTPEQAGRDAEPTGGEAQFINMQVYSDEYPPKRFPWRQSSPDDLNPASRRYGDQALDFVIEGPCNLVFDLFTRHESPLTGRTIDMRWGPFLPNETTNNEGR